MKRCIVIITCFVLLIVIMASVVLFFRKRDIKENDKILIVATLFPEYDFAKQIVGDKADVKLLLNSGVETHNYEPTAQDMITILEKCDIFLYTGEDLEPWTSNIIKNLKETDCKIVDVSEGINLIKKEEFEKRHLNSEINYDSEVEESHEEIYDEHIWLSPINAKVMLNNILNAVIQVDGQNTDFYRLNADKYRKEIDGVDTDIRNLLTNSEKKEIAIGGEFAYTYLINEYNLNFVSVYSNCGEGEDPSISKVKSVIDYINKYKLPVVYYQELSEGTVARMIAEETNAKPLVLYSIHNADIEKDTYVSLMKENVQNLKEGLIKK